ncbi:Cytochrome P450 [Quillaja saponaria]|uniref:Cytochrome P450 n=1 Tax=Quillaja saponaria TaxID=32244 RepID=A0AAD7KTL0_QUISA|nr:Cytochrome P450 [Quillaja saponaria]
MQNVVHQKLLKLLEKLVKSGDSFDLHELLLRFTFDNICVTAFGIDPGCLAFNLPEIPFAKAFEEATELTLRRFIVPPFVWAHLRYFGLGYEKRIKEAIQIVHDFAEKTVMEKQKELCKSVNLNGHSDLLSRLMKIQDSEADRQDNYKFYRDFCVSFILAGRDTSSVALAWFFWLVNKYPEVETRILNEIKDILGHQECKNENPYEHDVVFSEEDLKKMVYLQAALSESLSLYSSVPIDFKEVLEDDVFPDGTFIKKGSRVVYSIFSMARMESI